MKRFLVLNEVDTERDYQDNKFGPTHDDKLTTTEWSDTIENYLCNAEESTSPATQYKQARKVAAVAVAWMESIARKEQFAA